MDPITTVLGFMMAAVIGCVIVVARSFTPADFTYLAVDGDTVTVEGGGE